MASKTAAQIEAQIRFRGDFRNTQRFPAADIQREIQASWTELYELVADVNEGYFDTTASATTAVGVAFVATPADGWRIRAVDLILTDGSVVELDRVGIEDRNRFSPLTGMPVAFRLTARGIDLYPTPDAAYTLRVTYTPSAPSLFGSQFVGARAVTILDGGAALEVANPEGTAPQDTLLLVIAAESEDGDLQPAAIPNGWVRIVALASVATRSVRVWRRAARDSDSTHTFDTIGGAALGAVLLAYRNLDPAVAVVDSDIADVAASASFPCPSVTTTNALDVVLGVVWSATGTAFIAPPGTGTERIEVNQNSDGTSRTLEVFEVAPGIAGNTAVLTATAAQAQAHGIAASVALRVGAPREYYNGWEEYVIYATLVRLTLNEERDTSTWQGQLDRAWARITSGAGGRNSAGPQLIPLMDDY